MADLFTTGAAWLNARLKSAGATREITLFDQHGTLVAKTVDATPGQTDWDEDNLDGVVTRTESRDWIVATSELDDALGDVRPDRGWIITDSLDDAQYEVFAPGDAPWHYCDTGHKRIRIHTKSLDAEQ